MDFVKKHYEKVLLSVVLLGLAVAAALLPMKVSTIREEITKNIPNPKPKDFKPYDLSTNQVVMNRLKADDQFSLSGPHNLFNPVRWQKRPDGELVKTQFGAEQGAAALKFVKKTPLRTLIAYEGVTGTGDSIRYRVGLTREADKNAANRPKKTLTLTPGNKSLGVELREVKGPKEAPTELVLEVDDSGRISIGPEKAFSKTAGWMVGLKYPPENNKPLNNLRVDSNIFLGGESYNIVAISENEIVVSSKSSSKRTTVKLNPAP